MRAGGFPDSTTLEHSHTALTVFTNRSRRSHEFSCSASGHNSLKTLSHRPHKSSELASSEHTRPSKNRLERRSHSFSNSVFRPITPLGGTPTPLGSTTLPHWEEPLRLSIESITLTLLGGRYWG